MASVPWFVAPPEDWGDKELRLPESESHHALKVLRVAPPDLISVTDGHGTVARCAAARTDGNRLVAEILDRNEHRRVRPEVVVYQGAVKGAKLDSTVERLAELGVAEVWVYESSRSVVRWDEAKATKLLDRWGVVARSAAKQSRNAFMLKPMGVVSWAELVRHVAKEDLAIALWEQASLPLRTAFVEAADRIALIVGPEGGLAPEEAQGLADAGAQVVSLGPRILRTENAPVVAVSALLFHYGAIG